MNPNSTRSGPPHASGSTPTPELRVRAAAAWGEGSNSTAVFHDLSDENERALLDAAMAWRRQEFDGGYGAISWPSEFGGAGLPGRYEEAFQELEADYDTAGHLETFCVTLHLVAPTIARLGTTQQRDLVPRFLRTSELCCQLFSEPNAGSDLAGLATRAVPDGDSWVVKTAFLIPMDLPGITIVPIREMSGSASFNEVFYDVRIEDSHRIGDVGEG